ncbi:Single Cache domain 2 [uncultured archaeon]|nr:Single Cache domain 2 [uncultured archaeon]
MRNAIALCAMLFIVTAIAFGVSTTRDAPNESVNQISSSIPLAQSSSLTELVDFVKEARDYARDVGRERACQEFDNKTGKFVRGDLYIYAYDFQGTNIAHPFRPDFIGENKINLTDPNGVTLIKDLANCSRRGEDFTYFIFPNPDHASKDELKVGYAAKVDDSWWVGSGVYLSDVPAFFPPESRENLVAFVDSAVKYAEENGREKALAAFNDRNGSFVRGNLYIFAYDYNGTVLSLPHQPTLLGSNRLDAKDSNGIRFVHNCIDQAKRGSGYLYYLYGNPGMNMKDDLKLGYVKSVDSNWWLGAGIYASESNTTNATSPTYLGEISGNSTGK